MINPMKKLLVIALVLAMMLPLIKETKATIYEYDTFYTENFEYQIPKGWASKYEEGKNYYYKTKIGDPSAGYYMTMETELENKHLTGQELQEEYFAFIEGARGSKDGNIQKEVIIEGRSAFIYDLSLIVDGENYVVAGIVYYVNGHLFAMLYTKAGNQIKDLEQQAQDMSTRVYFIGSFSDNNAISAENIEITDLVTPNLVIPHIDVTDLATYSYDDLLRIWEQSGELLRQAGYYPYTELVLRDSGDEVSALQNRLTELNYYSKPITGKYDSNTETAMKAFEKANGFKEDGKASVEEQKSIFSISAIAKPTPTPKPTPRIATPQEIKGVASANSVAISWGAVKGAQKYNLYRSTSSDGNYQFLTSVTSTSYTDKSVSKGSVYYYKVESVSGDNISKQSNAKKVSVPTPTPTPDPRKEYGSFNYNNYFRYPENYTNQKFKISGKVVQVLGSRTSGFDLRVATKGSYSDVVYVTVNFDPGFNILEDDKLFLYCRGRGTHTYTSTMGASITLPLFDCDRLELRK